MSKKQKKEYTVNVLNFKHPDTGEGKAKRTLARTVLPTLWCKSCYTFTTEDKQKNCKECGLELEKFDVAKFHKTRICTKCFLIAKEKTHKCERCSAVLYLACATCKRLHHLGNYAKTPCWKLENPDVAQQQIVQVLVQVQPNQQQQAATAVAAALAKAHVQPPQVQVQPQDNEDEAKQPQTPKSPNAATLLPSSIEQFSVTNVGTWLQKLGFSKYVEKFANEQISGFALIRLSDQDFQNLGVAIGDKLTLRHLIDKALLISAPAQPIPYQRANGNGFGPHHYPAQFARHNNHHQEENAPAYAYHNYYDHAYAHHNEPIFNDHLSSPSAASNDCPSWFCNSCHLYLWDSKVNSSSPTPANGMNHQNRQQLNNTLHRADCNGSQDTLEQIVVNEHGVISNPKFWNTLICKFCGQGNRRANANVMCHMCKRRPTGVIDEYGHWVHNTIKRGRNGDYDYAYPHYHVQLDGGQV